MVSVISFATKTRTKIAKIMIRIKVFNREGNMIDETRLYEDAWHVLMPGTLGTIIKELSGKHQDIWTRLEIEVL